VQKKQIELLQQQNTMFKKKINLQQKQIEDIRNSIDSKIAKEMHFQSLSVQQRMDQFIFDSKITNKNAK
jgi:hypothetical protein